MTLPIQLVVSASILLAPPLLGTDPFGRGLLIGSSVNNRTAPNELFAIYRSPEAVKADYGVETPEYRIAQRYFAQIPRPKSLMIATVESGSTTASFIYNVELPDNHLVPQVGDTLTVVVNGQSYITAAFSEVSPSAEIWVRDELAVIGQAAGFTVSLDINGVDHTWTLTNSDPTALNISITSSNPSNVMFGVNPVVLSLPAATGTALERVQTVWDVTQSFYGVTYTEEIPAAQMQAVVDWCQSHYRLPFFVMTASAEAIATVDAINLLGYYTHVTTYHHDHDEVGAIMGMALDQKFDQPNGIKTLKFKTLVGTEPTVIGETLAGQLDAAGVNYYSSYGNPDAPVLMYSQGFAGAGKFADFVMGLHWLRNDAQVEVFNTFRANPKLDQTESGMSILKAAVARSCMRGGDNGLIAEGQWNGQPLGTVNTGDYLPTGYYIYADKIRNQTQQMRETRQAQPISVLIKGAGALHGADIAFIGEQ